ncbi:MAG: substrate-binding periplasmic protein [Rickettsiales bacterium]
MRFLFLTSACIGLFVTHAWALPSAITIAADTWCPYNCNANLDQQGYVVDITKAIFEPKGITVNYEITPWTRAVKQTRKGKYTAIIGATTSEGKGFIFPREMIGFSAYHFYTNAKSHWKFTGSIDSLKLISLGVVEGYSYSDAIDRYIASHKNDRERIQVLSGNNAAAQNIKKLRAKRIDVMIEDPNVVKYTLSTMNTPNTLRDAGATAPIKSDSALYLAFSPKHPDAKALAKLFDEGIRTLRKTGKLKKILTRYGMKDWQ